MNCYERTYKPVHFGEGRLETFDDEKPYKILVTHIIYDIYVYTVNNELFPFSKKRKQQQQQTEKMPLIH